MAVGAPAAITLPELPYREWEATKQTLHLFTQVVGKIRLKLHPKLNHWWHVTLYPTPCGLSTNRIPVGNGSFEITFDFYNHLLIIHTSADETRSFSLKGLSVADFYRKTMDALAELDIKVKILAKPYMHKSTTPYAEDTENATYDADAVDRFGQALSQISSVFEEFRGQFLGKSTPVHFFWHSFDLVLTRFSGRKGPPREGSQVEREAYSHEVISFGFWPGDDNLPEPAFYCYAYPEPKGLEQQAIQPSQAFWQDMHGSHYAILKYADLRASKDPRATLLAFLQSTYDAGSKLADWPSELVP